MLDLWSAPLFAATLVCDWVPYQRPHIGTQLFIIPITGNHHFGQIISHSSTYMGTYKYDKFYLDLCRKQTAILSIAVNQAKLKCCAWVWWQYTFNTHNYYMKMYVIIDKIVYKCVYDLIVPQCQAGNRSLQFLRKTPHIFRSIRIRTQCNEEFVTYLLRTIVLLMKEDRPMVVFHKRL